MTIRIHPPYTPAVINEPNLTETASEIIDLGSLPIRLSVNSIVSNSAANAVSFIDGVRSTGTITITSFAAAHLTKASGTVTVVDYTALAGAVLTVAGHALTEGAEWTAATSNDATADSLASAIDSLSEVDAANPAANAITVVAHTAGAAGNSITLATSDAVNLTVSGAFLTGGIDAAVVTVAGHALVESTDWNSVTNNNTAADNLAAAIDALSEVTAANPAAAVITVRGATVGTAGNVTTTKTGGGVTVQQAALTGGLDSDVIGSPDYTINAPDHGFSTGLKVNYDKLAGTTITNLVDNTDYFVIKVDDDTLQLSATDGGAAIHISDADDSVGGGSFTLTPTALDVDVTVSGSNDGENFVELDSDTLSSNGNLLYEYPTISLRYIKIEVEPNDSEADVRVVLHSKL